MRNSRDSTPLADRMYIHVVPEERLGLIRLRGVVSGEELIEASRQLHELDGWDDGYDVIWDCSRVHAHLIAFEDVPTLIHQEVESGAGQNYLINSPVEADYLLSDMLSRKMRQAGKQAAVYRTMEDVLKAMGRSSLPVPLKSEV